MTIKGIQSLLSESYPYPELVADQLCNLVARPCTMVPFTQQAFPNQMDEFNTEYAPARLLDRDEPAPEANIRLIKKAPAVESYFAKRLWTKVLNPALEGFSTKLVAVPYRDTVFESAIYADYNLDWKIEAYLTRDGDTAPEFDRIRTTKKQYLDSLRDGKYPTEASANHKLTEIRVKSELFGYPSCCTQQFLNERETRFKALLDIGPERIRELQNEYDDPNQLWSTFRDELRTHGLTLEELNPESRIVQQLEYINLGQYFEEWSYEELSEFYQQKATQSLPEFFYGFFTADYYPHNPRCEESVDIGRRIESALQDSIPELVSIYRMSLMRNVFSYMGFDDLQLHRRLLSDSIADPP